MDDTAYIKLVVKAELGSTTAMSPSLYSQYVESIAERFNLHSDLAKNIIRDALNELPVYED